MTAMGTLTFYSPIGAIIITLRGPLTNWGNFISRSLAIWNTFLALGVCVLAFGTKFFISQLVQIP